MGTATVESIDHYYYADICAAFLKYCEDKAPPALSADVIGYIRQCLNKATRIAAAMGEELDFGHSPMLALLATEAGRPELIIEFLLAIPPR